MRCVVTGGAGFIGSILVDRFVDDATSLPNLELKNDIVEAILETQDKLLKNRLGESNYKPNSVGAGVLADIQTLKEDALEYKFRFADTDELTQTFDFTGMSDQEQSQAIANIDADKNTVVVIKSNDGQTDNIIWGGSALSSAIVDANGNLIKWKYSYP